jgi:hypothetical protein
MKKSTNEKMDGFNRRELLNKAREIVNFIEQAHKSGLAAHEVEEALFRQVLELGRRALEMFFLLCGDGDEGGGNYPYGRTVGAAPWRLA